VTITKLPATSDDLSPLPQGLYLLCAVSGGGRVAQTGCAKNSAVDFSPYSFYLPENYAAESNPAIQFFLFTAALNR